MSIEYVTSESEIAELKQLVDQLFIRVAKLEADMEDMRR